MGWRSDSRCPSSYRRLLAEEEIRWSPVMAVQLGAGVGTQNGLGLKGPAMVEGQTLFQLALRIQVEDSAVFT